MVQGRNHWFLKPRGIADSFFRCAAAQNQRSPRYAFWFCLQRMKEAFPWRMLLAAHPLYVLYRILLGVCACFMHARVCSDAGQEPQQRFNFLDGIGMFLQHCCSFGINVRFFLCSISCCCCCSRTRIVISFLFVFALLLLLLLFSLVLLTFLLALLVRLWNAVWQSFCFFFLW